ERALQPLPHLVSSGVDELFGEVDARRVGRRVDGGVAKVAVGPGLECGGDPTTDLLSELLDGVELGGVGDEVVVELGEPLLANLLDGDLEAPQLSRQVLWPVV